MTNKQINYVGQTTNINTMSSNFSYQKIYRSELKKINAVRTNISNPASDFLNLAASAICENVDTSNVCGWNENGGVQCYLIKQRLKEKFNTDRWDLIIKRLDVLQNIYNVIKYKIITNKNGKTRIYFQFNKCFLQIDKGNYSFSNADARATALAARMNTGFFFVNKLLFATLFFFEGNVQQGSKDMYWLFRFNSVQQDKTDNDVQKNCCVVKWNSDTAKTSWYITYSELAYFLHSKITTVARQIKNLENQNIVKKKFYRNRGTVLFLNTFENENQHNKENFSLFCEFLSDKYLKSIIYEKMTQKKYFSYLNVKPHAILEDEKAKEACSVYFFKRQYDDNAIFGNHKKLLKILKMICGDETYQLKRFVPKKEKCSINLDIEYDEDDMM